MGQCLSSNNIINQNSQTLTLDYELTPDKGCLEQLIFVCGTYYTEIHHLFQCTDCQNSDIKGENFCRKQFYVFCGQKNNQTQLIYTCKNCFQLEKSSQISICGSYIQENQVYFIDQDKNFCLNPNKYWCGMGVNNSKKRVQCTNCFEYDQKIIGQVNFQNKSYCNEKMTKKCSQTDNCPRYYYNCRYWQKQCPCKGKEEITIYCGMINRIGFQHQCSKCYVQDVQKLRKSLKQIKAEEEQQQQQQQQEEIDQVYEADNIEVQEALCKICLDSEIEYIFKNCGHAVVCENCLPQLRFSICPLCRKDIENNLIKLSDL